MINSTVEVVNSILLTKSLIDDTVTTAEFSKVVRALLSAIVILAGGQGFVEKTKLKLTDVIELVEEARPRITELELALLDVGPHFALVTSRSDEYF